MNFILEIKIANHFLVLKCRITRCCSTDCVLKGVQFKKGALVFLIIDNIHYDPKVWPDPEMFNPDRYVQYTLVCIGHRLL